MGNCLGNCRLRTVVTQRLDGRRHDQGASGRRRQSSPPRRLDLRPVSEADAPRFVVPVGAFGVTGAAEHADALAALGRMAEGEGPDRLAVAEPVAAMTRPAAA